MAKQRLDFLFRKCLDNTINNEEKSELQQLLTEPANAEFIKSNIDNLLAEPATETLTHQTKQSILSAITNADKQTATVKPINRQWIKYAAAAVIILSAGLYYLTTNNSNKTTPAQTEITDIQPGGNRATLTLADGTTILLDSANNSTLAQQGSIQIIKLDNGQIAYKPLSNQNNSSEILYNTIATPVGGQYQIQLPDGTNVWLNATSSIRFPAVFTGSERNVELTGEAYFEVAKNSSQPFIVNTNNTLIKVLGTAFNIMAYTDEKNIRTTLITGTVNVTSNNKSNILKPGQQANIENGSMHIVNNANIEEALAWKNGKFYFNNVDIKTVMRQIGRWYDVEVVFEGNISNEKFEGEISRDSPLSEVLKILELTSIHYRLEGNKLIVLP